jgi:hypothetical protein
VIKDFSPDEAGPYIVELASDIKFDPEIFAPVDAQFLAKYWTRLMETGTAFAYGLFEQDECKGILLGSIIPDLFSGRLHGVEFLWKVKSGANGLPLQKHFENRCREAECFQVVFGLNYGSETDASRLSNFYLRKGYQPYALAYKKNLKYG